MARLQSPPYQRPKAAPSRGERSAFGARTYIEHTAVPSGFKIIVEARQYAIRFRSPLRPTPRSAAPGWLADDSRDPDE